MRYQSPWAIYDQFLPWCKFLIFFFANSLVTFRRSALYEAFSLKLNRPFQISNVRHPFSSWSTNWHSDGYFATHSTQPGLEGCIVGTHFDDRACLIKKTSCLLFFGKTCFHKFSAFSQILSGSTPAKVSGFSDRKI